MSFFSDALGHSGFTGIAIGALCGAVQPLYFAVGLSVLFALLFSFVRSRSQPVGRYDHRRLFLDGSRARHFHRHAGRQELYKVQHAI